jgi:hypothetical protein
LGSMDPRSMKGMVHFGRQGKDSDQPTCESQASRKIVTARNPLGLPMTGTVDKGPWDAFMSRIVATSVDLE